jgi:3'-phosphoadenosine 5'-phosphosulfate sulfotransferase (PAPS reductase)/FAD synthetase
MIATYFREYLPKIHFVFANTGIEYRATIQHLDYLREHYDIEIDEVRGMPIPIAVRKYGVPFISKFISKYLSRLKKHGFAWEDENISTLLIKYPRTKAALRFWCNEWGDKSKFNISYKKGLKQFLISEKPKTKFSAECCNVSKKNPIAKYEKDIICDLSITGERKSEGGERSNAYGSCFVSSHGKDKFMPLYYWDSETKKYYSEKEHIKNSDCYEEYGLERTGCVGCPFAKNLWKELEIMKKYEPQCYKLCVNVFGESYKLRKKYEDYKKAENGR